MSEYSDMPEEFDEITQLQLDEFGKQLMGATQAPMVMILCDTGKALQTSIHHKSADDRATSHANVLRTLVSLAGGALESATGGKICLKIQMADGTLHDALPAEAHVLAVPRG